MPHYNVTATISLFVGADDPESACLFLRELIDDDSFGPTEFMIRATALDDEDPHPTTTGPADDLPCPNCGKRYLTASQIKAFEPEGGTVARLDYCPHCDAYVATARQDRNGHAPLQARVVMPPRPERLNRCR